MKNIDDENLKRRKNHKIIEKTKILKKIFLYQAQKKKIAIMTIRKKLKESKIKFRSILCRNR